MSFPLIAYWPALVGALVLLFFPPSLWLSRSAKRHLSQPGTAGEFGLLRGFRAWQNWADLVRGYAGTYLLLNHAFEPPEEMDWNLLGWKAGILLFALLIQTVRRYRKRSYFLAPIFFLWGITLVIVGPLLAFYGILASVLVAGVAENLEWKLPVMAVVIGAAAYLLSSIGPMLYVNLVAIVFPLIVTFCGRGRMVFLMPVPKRS